MNDKEELLSLAEVAQFLGCGRAQSYRLIRPGPGALPAYRIGRSLRVRQGDLLDWLESNRYTLESLRKEGSDNPKLPSARFRRKP